MALTGIDEHQDDREHDDSSFAAPHNEETVHLSSPEFLLSSGSLKREDIP